MNKTRFQLDLSTKESDRVTNLVDQCDFETKKDLFKDAISLFEWAVEEVKKGLIIASIDEKTKETKLLSMNSLRNAARKTS